MTSFAAVVLQAFSMDVAISCLLQILTPLKWLHSRKPSVPHGDLHPGNVLLSATGDLKLTDFGKSADGRPVSFWGAIEYQAAEQLQGAPPAVSSDIYSVGLLWYEMLIGQNPFRSSRLEDLVQTLHELPGHTERRHVAGDEQYERTVAEYIDAHSRARLEFAPAKVRDHESLRDQSEVADVLLRCLAFAPQERPQDAGALYEELSRFQTPSLSQVALKDAMPSKDGDTGGTLALQPTYQPLTYTLDIEAVQAAAETANATYADGVVGGDSLLYLQSRDQIRIRDTHFAAARADILDTPSAQSAPLQQSRGSEVPRGVIDRVHFTATSPLTVCPGTTFVLDIWAHLEQQRQQVLEQAKQQYDSSDVQSRTKGPVRIARETVLTVRLTLEGLVVDESEDSLYWEGTVGNAGFQVRVPKDVASGSYPGKATIHAGGGQIAKLYFSITVGEKSVPAGSLPLRECRHRTAFASYASSDRDEVLAIVQGIQKALPHLDIYLDVVKLRSGQRWQDELDRVVASRDIFYLFWSAAASKSDWVEREWRCAYEHRGLDYIDPIPIVSPYTVPPPQETRRFALQRLGACLQEPSPASSLHNRVSLSLAVSEIVSKSGLAGCFACWQWKRRICPKPRRAQGEHTRQAGQITCQHLHGLGSM